MLDFTLKNIDDRLIALKDYPDAKGFIIVFTCNHCPYAIAYERRLVALHARFAERGVPLLAINPNDASRYPADSFDQMKIRSAQRGFKFPYLHDATQEIAKNYGAERTPHVFLVQQTAEGEKSVIYSGAIDDNWGDAAQVQEEFLADAVEAMLAGDAPKMAVTPSVGCSVKWKM